MGTPKQATPPEIAAARRMQQEGHKPMQGPPTEIQSLRDEVMKLRDRIMSNEYAAALSAHEATRGRY